MPRILHADLNSFFASVEQQYEPNLRGKPIGILKAVGRTCIIAASDEAKKFGVITGTASYEAKKLCPQIRLVPANFPLYEQITQKFIRLCYNFSDVVEVFSLDEVFLDITYTARIFGGPLGVAEKIQSSLKSELGEYIGCSIGVAQNKLLAKMASGMAPRRGILVINNTNKADLLAKVPFTEVCGIGRGLTQKLAALGVINLPQILNIHANTLLTHFGPYWSKQLVKMAKGEDDSPLVTVKDLAPAKSVSRTYTLYHDTTDIAQIKALIRNLTEEAGWKLRQMNLVGRQFGLTIRGGRSGQSGHLTEKVFTDNSREIFEKLYTIYNHWHWPGPVRFCGVWISLLQPKANQTQFLFNEDKKQANLLTVTDSINQRFGLYTVYPASLINQTWGKLA
ncbi:MAG: DNA polymerase IV [Patescibacteria group bacterium]